MLYWSRWKLCHEFERRGNFAYSFFYRCSYLIMRHRLYDNGRLGLPRQRRHVFLVDVVREFQLRALRRRRSRRRTVVRRCRCRVYYFCRVLLFARNKSTVILKRHLKVKMCSASNCRCCFAIGLQYSNKSPAWLLGIDKAGKTVTQNNHCHIW